MSVMLTLPNYIIIRIIISACNFILLVGHPVGSEHNENSRNVSPSSLKFVNE